MAHGPFTGVTRGGSAAFLLQGAASRTQEGAALLPAPALPSQHCSACQEAPATQCVHTPRAPSDLDLM